MTVRDLSVRIVISLAAIASLATAARSQTRAGGASEQADALWREGKRLVTLGQPATACAKFEESLAAMAKLGTRLSLADCYERVGRTASAWTSFQEGAAEAQLRKDPREAFARGRMAALAPRLSRLAISSPGVATPNLEVSCDGKPVPPSALDQAMPIDPGEHVVAAMAPELRAWETRVTVRGDGQTVTIAIPPPERVEPRQTDEPPSLATIAMVASPVVTAAPADRGAGLRTGGLVTGAAGVAALAAGVYFGIRARDLSNQVSDMYNAGDADVGEAANRFMIAGLGIGGAAILTGGILYYLGARDRGEPLAGVGMTGSGATIAIRGTF